MEKREKTKKNPKGAGRRKLAYLEKHKRIPVELETQIVELIKKWKIKKGYIKDVKKPVNGQTHFTDTGRLKKQKKAK